MKLKQLWIIENTVWK